MAWKQPEEYNKEGISRQSEEETQKYWDYIRLYEKQVNKWLWDSGIKVEM